MTSPLSVRVECADCANPGDITYRWSLRQLDNGTYQDVELENITLTGRVSK